MSGQKHKYVWYSMCSIHGRGIHPQCGMCHAGSWIDENSPEWIADQKLFKDDVDAWRRKHNPPPATTAVCPECHGAGGVPSSSFSNQDGDDYDPCPTCNGSGIQSGGGA